MHTWEQMCRKHLWSYQMLSLVLHAYLVADLSAGAWSQILVFQVPRPLLVHQTRAMQEAELDGHKQQTDSQNSLDKVGGYTHIYVKKKQEKQITFFPRLAFPGKSTKGTFELRTLSVVSETLSECMCVYVCVGGILEN